MPSLSAIPLFTQEGHEGSMKMLNRPAIQWQHRAHLRLIDARAAAPVIGAFEAE